MKLHLMISNIEFALAPMHNAEMKLNFQLFLKFQPLRNLMAQFSPLQGSLYSQAAREAGTEPLAPLSLAKTGSDGGTRSQVKDRWTNFYNHETNKGFCFDSLHPLLFTIYNV